MKLSILVKQYTSYVCILLCLTYALTYLSSTVVNYFSSQPADELEELQIWRLLTSPYTAANTFELVVLVGCFLPLGYNRELAVTTRRYIPYFVISNIIG